MKTPFLKSFFFCVKEFGWKEALRLTASNMYTTIKERVGYRPWKQSGINYRVRTVKKSSKNLGDLLLSAKEHEADQTKDFWKYRSKDKFGIMQKYYNKGKV